jgi:hypothetical protein
MNAVNVGKFGNEGTTDAAELDRVDAEVVDVALSWGDLGDRTVLEVKHVNAGGRLVVGEEAGCDLFVPAEAIGASRVEILRFEPTRIVLAPPAGATVLLDGWPCTESELELRSGQVAEVSVAKFSLRFGVVAAPKKIAAAKLDTHGLRGVIGSALVHAMAIAAVAAYMPALGASDADTIDADRLAIMQHMLDASAQRELEQQPADPGGGSQGSSSGEPLKGPQAKGPAGTAGTQTATTQGRRGIQGDAKPEDATAARDRMKSDVRNSEFLGMISMLAPSDPNAPTLPWGTVQNGSDNQSAMGSLFGPTIADALGTGGLGMMGNDEGGGGRANILGLDGFHGLDGPGGPGTCAPGAKCDGIGVCPPGAKCDGIGHSTGLPPKGHPPATFTMRTPIARVNGHLDPLVIQRVIQLNSGRFRSCYASGLRTNPELSGTVRVKFIIDRNGGVSTSVDAGSALPDASVTSCVVRTFSSLSFPAPDGGIVTVEYGFAFSPTE